MAFKSNPVVGFPTPRGDLLCGRVTCFAIQREVKMFSSAYLKFGEFVRVVLVLSQQGRDLLRKGK